MSTTSLEPYLIFNGDCAAAIALYSKAFRGEMTMSTTYADAPMPSPPEWKNRIMHANFRAPGVSFMASDTGPDNAVTAGSSVQLSINHHDPAEQDRVWSVLAEGGTIRMPLASQFWGARFGMLTDRFGIQWMFNCEQTKK